MTHMVELVYLAAEKAAVSTLFARAPQLKVVMSRVLDIEFAYEKPIKLSTTIRKRRPQARTHETCERREIDVHSNRRGRAHVVSE